ncbi:DUF1453 domain-containing protein [Lysobacter tyrosinilyticus]
MPLLVLLPLLVVALLVLWLLLLPLAIWQRYRGGRARRRVVGWVATINAWSLLVSSVIFLCSAWLTGHWVVAALQFAAGGLAIGVVVGVLGLALTRFESTPLGLFYTPNRWLILALTLLVLSRIAYGMYRMRQAWITDSHAVWLSQQGTMLTFGGLLLGYYLAYAWGLRSRLRRM